MDGTALSIEFEQHCLGGQVAWDRVYNLLAVELRPAQPEDAAATAAGAEGITVAILEPSCPESHFLGHIPLDAAAPVSGDAPERLAHLLWSPPGTARALLAVTSRGRAFLWTQGGGGGGSEAAAGGGGGAGAPAAPAAAAAAAPHVRCVDSWVCSPAFQVFAPGEVLCCRFLEPPGPWDPSAAPPNSAREGRAVRTLGELLGFWRSQGLEGTLASAVAASGGGGGGGVLHWVRTGLLCCAVVTSEAQLQVFFRSFGGVGRQYAWTAAPPVPLVIVGAPLRHADVAAVPGRRLHVLAVPYEVESDVAGEVVVVEVAGSLAALDPSGEFIEQPMVSPACAMEMGRGKDVAHASFIPNSAGTALFLVHHDRLMGSLRAVCYRQPPGSEAGDTMQVLAGGPEWERAGERALPALDSDDRRRLAACASPCGSTLAVWLPSGQLVSLLGPSLRDPRLAALPANNGGGGAGGLAASPNGCLLAAATPSGRALRFEWALPPPTDLSAAVLVGLELSKRLCHCLVSGAAGWDASLLLRQLTGGWGAAPLKLCCDVVDAAVHGEPPSSRAPYAAAWDRLKAPLLAAAAPDPLALCVAVDAALRGWVGHVAGLLEGALPSKEELEAMKAEKGVEGLDRLLVTRAQPIHFWLNWLVNVTLVLFRGLMLWAEQRRTALAAEKAGGPTAGGRGLSGGPVAEHFGPGFVVAGGLDCSGSGQGGDGAGAVAAVAAAQQAAQRAQRVWSAAIGRAPDCAMGPRLLADSGFCKALQKALHNGQIFASRLRKVFPAGAPVHKSAALLPDLLKGFASIAKFVQDTAAAESLPSGSDAAAMLQPGAAQRLLDATEARVEGPWRLHYATCNGGPKWEIVAATLARLAKMATGLQSLQPGTRAELLEAAHLLNLLPASSGASAGLRPPALGTGPARPSYSAAAAARWLGCGGAWGGASGGGAWQPGGETKDHGLWGEPGAQDPEALYCGLLGAREVAFGRLEGAAALPTLEGWDGGWGAEDAGEGGGEGCAAQQVQQGGLASDLSLRPSAAAALLGGSASLVLGGGGGGGSLAPPAQSAAVPPGAGSKRRGAEWDAAAACWREERDAALGLLGPGSTALQGGKRARIDAIIGRSLSWEHSLTYASPCGTIVTGELRPGDLTQASPNAWQLAFVGACPVSGAPWRRLSAA